MSTVATAVGTAGRSESLGENGMSPFCSKDVKKNKNNGNKISRSPSGKKCNWQQSQHTQ